ncbi:MAG: hypothetical protein KTR30_28820 [Saprospiraceae bacterium]|nr:hypothetical protein [Saprospiraceae bacterium]
MSKPKIEAIYPLSAMQQSLLLHSIYEKEDQGFLQVTCTLKGALQLEHFKKAWERVALRHPVLRTSIHWENMEKPVQVVHPLVELDWQVEDWQGDSATGLKNLDLVKEDDRQEGIALTQAPISRFRIFQKEPEVFILLWTCHHILLDGWSTTIILKDVLAYYAGALAGKAVELDALPSYKHYLKWVQQQDQESAAIFWKEKLAGFHGPSLIAPTTQQEAVAGLSFQTSVRTLPVELSERMQAFGQQEHITQSTLIQGVWAILLSKLLQKEDIAFGNTVSGRSADIPNMDLLAGLFMNVLPVGASIKKKQSIGDWMRALQHSVMTSHKYEHISLTQILNWASWKHSSTLFDTLLVYENFPWENMEAGGVQLLDFQGGLTTTYPLTLVIQPGREVHLLFQYQQERVSPLLIEWLENGLSQLLAQIVDQPSIILADLLNFLPTPTGVRQAENQPGYLQMEQANFIFSKKVDDSYVAPQNPIELQLTKMWEELFGRHPIGVQENFFQIGGNSLLAVRLFAHIEQSLGKNLPPVSLIQHPTIRELAGLLQTGEEEDQWSALVPIRASGESLPLFCVHAGGGHVFFYNALGHHMGADQPVYAIQPVGLDGVASYHESIEEMATHYVAEIKRVQAVGPYALLGTCFSNAVCFEMAKQLKNSGDEIALLAIIDSAVHDWSFVAPPSFFQKVQRLPGRVWRFGQRFRSNAGEALSKMVSAKRNKLRDLVDNNLYFLKNKQARNLARMQDKLADLYLDYQWERFPGEITLIRSRQLNDDSSYDFHLSQWEELTDLPLAVHVVDGHHETLFDEPEVQHLSRQLGECLKGVNSPQL